MFAEDKAACEEILRTILEDDGLTVIDVVVQSSERNLYGRSVRLDGRPVYPWKWGKSKH